MLNRFARAFVTRLLTPVARRPQPERRHVHRNHWGLLRRAVLPAARVLVGDRLHHGLRLLRHARRHHGPAVRADQRLGAFLDSTLDRFGDAAVFGELLLYFAQAPNGGGNWFALACLSFAFVTSYARARPEGLGVTKANVGVAAPTGCSVTLHRADRPVRWPDTVIVVVLGVLAVLVPASPWRSAWSRSAAPWPRDAEPVPEGHPVLPSRPPPPSDAGPARPRPCSRLPNGLVGATTAGPGGEFSDVRWPRGGDVPAQRQGRGPGCAPIMRGSARSSTAPRWRPWSGTVCGRTSGTGARRFGCPT